MLERLAEDLSQLYGLHGLELIAIIVVTWLLGALLDRIGRRHAQHQATLQKRRLAPWLRWLPALRVLLWLVALVLLGAVVLQTSAQEFVLIAIPGVLALGLAARHVAANVLAGLVLALDRRFQVGDVIRVGPHEGEVRAIGLRSVQLVSADGHLLEVPNRQFMEEASSNVTPDVAERQTRIVMVLPGETEVARAREIAYLAAAVSRYASPRRAPEVFIDSHFDQKFLLRLTIVGYVFDPAYEDHFRSDVVESLRQSLRSDKKKKATQETQSNLIVPGARGLEDITDS
jgi:small-conductance mechanosensitive channel